MPPPEETSQRRRARGPRRAWAARGALLHVSQGILAFFIVIIIYFPLLSCFSVDILLKAELLIARFCHRPPAELCAFIVMFVCSQKHFSLAVGA